jgi:hypothetical protein
VGETTSRESRPHDGYQGLPWFDRVWVGLLLFVVLIVSWRVIL